MKTDIVEISLSSLLDKAESSLHSHLAESPESTHVKLAAIFNELRAGSLRRKVYPSARDLYWDEPTTKAEQQCLDDALAVFKFLGKS